MSDDPKQECFSDGIIDDLITDLSKISGLFVIARKGTDSPETYDAFLNGWAHYRRETPDNFALAI